MQTQRDHVHAHQFQMGRMSSALVLGDPTSAENPSHRAMIGLFVGVMVAVLIVAGFAVYGWLVPGGAKSWRNPGVIIVEKETGNRYLYLGGELRPTLNLTSAMLIEGPASKIQLTSRNSLKGVPHGSPIGLAGAPQTMPDPSALVGGPWLVCLASSVGGPVNGLGLNLDPAARSTPLAPDRFEMVSGGGNDYLIWRDKKHKIADRTVPVALGVANAEPIAAPTAWLDALPDGAPLAVPTLPGQGDPGPAIGGRTYPIGQLFTQAGTDQLFVLRKEGLAPVNRTAFMLLQAAGRDPVQLRASAVADAPRSDDRSLTGLLPDLGAASWEDPAGRVLCERQVPAGKESLLSTPVLTDPGNASIKADGNPRVTVRPGTGLVVYPIPLAAPGKTPEPYLISDEGLRYSVPDSDSLSALRLSGRPMVPFPRDLLNAVTSGPVLSRKAIDLTEEG